MNTFRQLASLSEFEKRHLPSLKTLEDREIVIQIGLHQVEDNPLSLKRLLLIGFTPMATLHRRLDRLKRLGVVIQHRSDRDGRSIVLCLSSDSMKIYQRYGALIDSQGSTSAH